MPSLFSSSDPEKDCKPREIEAIPSSVLVYSVCQHARTGAEQLSDLLHIPLPGKQFVRVYCVDMILGHIDLP